MTPVLEPDAAPGSTETVAPQCVHSFGEGRASKHSAFTDTRRELNAC